MRLFAILMLCGYLCFAQDPRMEINLDEDLYKLNHEKLLRGFGKNVFYKPPTVRDASEVLNFRNNNWGAVNMGGIDPIFKTAYKISSARLPKITYKKRNQFYFY